MRQIRRLALFGSVLRDDFRADSDVDVLIEFEPESRVGLLGLARMERELSGLLGGRKVDIRTVQDLSRYFRDDVIAGAEVQYAQEAVAFVTGRTRGDLAGDRILTLALVKSIEIVGEAAARISIETRNGYPMVPWQDIVGMRNRLIHAYFDVDLNRVWDTATVDLPPLIAALEQIIEMERT